MPNITFNTMYADSEVIKSFINDDGEFDFNKAIPMPESLNVESGSYTDIAIAYYLTDRLTRTAEEGNLKKYLRNSFHVDWAEEVYRRTAEQISNGDLSDTDKLFSDGKKYVDNFNNYGHTTWYGWCLENWGTKWNAFDGNYIEGENETSFCTAWSAPKGVFDKICEMFPCEEIMFHSEYEEGFTDVFENQNGKCVCVDSFTTPKDYDDEDDE